MSFDTETRLGLLATNRSNEISVVYKDFAKLHKGLGSLELFHAQLMLEQVYAHFEREVFKHIKSS